MRYLTIAELMEIYQRVMTQSGGLAGIHDFGSLESALAQPQMSFGGQELYPTLLEKAAALGFSLINNHPFIDGNKRLGHAAMELFLVLNNYEIESTVDEQEQVILSVATGKLNREAFTAWLRQHCKIINLDKKL